MAKYVKLSQGASMFYDPSLRVKVLPGQVVELPKGWRTSSYLADRIRANHLNYASEAEYLEANNKSVKETDVEDTDEDTKTLAAPADMSKAALIKELLGSEYDYKEKELNKMKKAELVEEVEEIRTPEAE